MTITYTQKGMKITHSTGVVQILSVADLVRLKNSEERLKENISKSIALTDAHITKTQAEAE